MKENAYGVVVVLLGDENKFLILRHKEIDYGVNWSFPKGHCEEGETPLQTAMRELQEETQIEDIEILDTPLIREEYFIKNGVLKTNQYFIGIAKNKTVVIQKEEIDEYKWVTYNEAVETFMFSQETRKDVLDKAIEFLIEYDNRK